MWIRFDTFPDIFHIVYTIDIYINSHIVLNYFFYKSVPYCHPIALYARVHTLHERFVLHLESSILMTLNECLLQIIERRTLSCNSFSIIIGSDNELRNKQK